MKALVYDSKLCTGCRLCEQWCSVSHYGVINPAKTRIRIIRDNAKQQDNAAYCRQCVHPECVDACAFAALLINSTTGAVIVDTDACIGCGACIDACPYGVPSITTALDYVLICDLCGGDPECIRHCPEGAIRYSGQDESCGQTGGGGRND